MSDCTDSIRENWCCTKPYNKEQIWCDRCLRRMLIREKSKSYKKRMVKLSRKAKVNFPGKVSYVIIKEIKWWIMK